MKIFLLSIFWGLWFANFSVRTVISPLLPIIEHELNISHAAAGGIFSFLSVSYTISVLLSGLLSPRIGYKRSIAMGFMCLTISAFFFSYVETYAGLAVVSSLMGLGAGIYLPSAIPLLTGIIERKNWGKAIAFHETAASFSIFSIPLLVALVLRFFQWKTVFLMMSATCLVVFSLFLVFVSDVQPQQKKSVRLARVLVRRDFWIIAILWIFAAAGSLGLYNMIPLFLVEENGMPLELANTIFGISRIGGFFAAILTGFVVDRYGFKKVLFVVLSTTGLSTTVLAIAKPIPFLVIMLIVQATVSTAFFPAALVAVSKLTNPSERSIFTGTTIAVGVIVGLGLTPVLLGFIADVWNFQIGILFLGILTVLSSFLLKGI